MNNAEVIIAALERAPALVIPLVREVPQSVLKRRPKPHKWSAHEHACHLATVHPILSARLDLMLTAPEPQISPYFPGSGGEDGALLRGGFERGDGPVFIGPSASCRTSQDTAR